MCQVDPVFIVGDELSRCHIPVQGVGMSGLGTGQAVRHTPRHKRKMSISTVTIASSAKAAMKRALKWATLAGAALVMGQATLSAEDTVSVLMKQHLADLAGKEATVLTVDYTPGAASDSHVHPGSVFAYVLEGAVVSQLEGEQPVTYTKGQSWYEPPKKPHVVSKNASTTEPAKLLVFLLSNEGEATKMPIKSPGSGK
jgi:quercetin dioxygenase-like cupin family protein